MCGIAGVLDASRRGTRQQLEDTAARMARSLTHRGPDDEGTWVDPEVGIALGHRRLAVVDLSASGHQPMVSADGRFVLDYNGELYNAPRMAAELVSGGARFRGHSDTEVLLEAVARWGVRGALEHANGMFAFAVWDRHQRRLSLARDRLGEKPLYFGWFGDRFVFASELVAITSSRNLPLKVDRRALTLYLRLGYVPAPWSIIEGLSKLSPGHVLDISPSRPGRAEPDAYWSLPSHSAGGRTADVDAENELESRLRESVALRLTADVPLGAFLSGGTDSSLVVALMQQEARGRVRTFSIGFDEPGFDESGYSRAVATHLGTDHTEFVVTGDEAREVVPELPQIYDEPFADSSQIPTCILSRHARRDVTVVLTGDGGDELFSGYDRYAIEERIWRRVAHVPIGVRRFVANGVRGVPASVVDRGVDALGWLVGDRVNVVRPAEKLRRVAQVLDATSPQGAYISLMSQWQDPGNVALGASEPTTMLTEPARWPPGVPFAERLAAVDVLTYLPDDLLVKVDRAAMAFSLETRLPLLDHGLVEWSRGLPYDLKVRDGQRKWLLRRVLARHVPPELTERPKMGFGVPLGDWLRGPLRAWAQELLHPSRLRDQGYLEADAVQAAWRQHLKGDAGRAQQIWTVLTFQAWMDYHSRSLTS